jgi:uncharacterized protein with FMN-binding domain
VRRVILAIVTTAIGLVLLLSFKSHSASGGPIASIGSPNQNGTGTSGTNPSSTAGTGTTSKSSGSKSSGSKSGSSGSGSSGSGGSSKTVNGSTAQTIYGPIQVDITVKNGKITAVNVPVYPNGTFRDAQINQFALPQLIQETISANSANIDAVSGASYTSQGYIQSLQSAVDQAGI